MVPGGMDPALQSTKNTRPNHCDVALTTNFTSRWTTGSLFALLRHLKSANLFVTVVILATTETRWYDLSDVSVYFMYSVALLVFLSHCRMH